MFKNGKVVIKSLAKESEHAHTVQDIRLLGSNDKRMTGFSNAKIKLSICNHTYQR